MDEIRRLENQIEALQRQLREQNAKANQERQRIIDDNRRNLQSYQSDMQRAIREHDSDTQAEYEQLLRQYQSSINSDVQFELTQMSSDYNQLLEDVKRSEAQLLQKNKELEEAIQAIKKDVSRRNEGSSEEAKKYMKNAISVFKNVELKPHEKFMPKRLKIYYDSLQDGQQLYKAGLFEAATAIAISARSGLERLGYSIDDKKDEWEKQFDLFLMKLSYLQAAVEQEINEWKSEHPYNSNNKQIVYDIDYWSKGEFEKILLTAKKYNEHVNKYNKLGLEEYLKQSSSPSIDDLKNYIKDIDETHDLLKKIQDLYKLRYSTSCQRSEWGEKIIDFLTNEINLKWIEEKTGFKTVTDTDATTLCYRNYVREIHNEPELNIDFREWLKIVFENSSNCLIYIYIIPVESSSNVVNRIILHIDYDGPEQSIYTQDIYSHICEAIELEDNNDETISYAEDITALKISNNVTYRETGKDLEKEIRKNR